LSGGIIGHEQVARAAPDGFTFVVSSLGSSTHQPGLFAASRRSGQMRVGWGDVSKVPEGIDDDDEA
jgi:hypothetical protein